MTCVGLNSESGRIRALVLGLNPDQDVKLQQKAETAVLVFVFVYRVLYGVRSKIVRLLSVYA